MKYINSDTFGFVIFSPVLKHSDVAKQIGGTIISAGFVNTENWICHGESIGLGIKSRAEDTQNLSAHLKL